MAFRDAFPVLENIAYLNAGTDGPLPRAAIEQAHVELDAQLTQGRVYEHFMRRHELQDQLRDGYARLMHCESDDVAVTSGTSFGLGAILAGLDLGPGDEILTTDSEHPGLLGPLIAARHRGASVRAVPIAQLAEVGVPVILDGAQGAGAVPVDVHALGCVAYAAAGQKWLCGADGSGMI